MLTWFQYALAIHALLIVITLIILLINLNFSKSFKKINKRVREITNELHLLNKKIENENLIPEEVLNVEKVKFKYTSGRDVDLGIKKEYLVYPPYQKLINEIDEIDNLYSKKTAPYVKWMIFNTIMILVIIYFYYNNAV